MFEAAVIAYFVVGLVLGWYVVEPYRIRDIFGLILFSFVWPPLLLMGALTAFTQAEFWNKKFRDRP